MEVKIIYIHIYIYFSYQDLQHLIKDACFFLQPIISHQSRSITSSPICQMKVHIYSVLITPDVDSCTNVRLFYLLFDSRIINFIIKDIYLFSIFILVMWNIPLFTYS